MATTDTAIQLPTDQREGTTRVLLDLIGASKSDAGTLWSMVAENRDLYKNVQDWPKDQKPYEGAPTLVVPYLKSMMEALVGHMVDQCARRAPFFKVEGLGAEAKRYADNWTRHLQAQLIDEHVRYRFSFEQAARLAYRDGLCWSYVTWEERYRVRRRLEQEMLPMADEYGQALLGMDGQMQMQPTGQMIWGQPQNVLCHFGPKVTRLEIDKAGTFPAYSLGVGESSGCWIEQQKTGIEIDRAVKAGWYDAAAVVTMRAGSKGDKAQAATASGDTPLTTSDATLRELGTSGSGADSRFASQAFTITECYWEQPDKNGFVQDWFMAVHEPTQTLLAARPVTDNLFFHGRRPLVACRVLGDTQGVYGDSLGDLAGGFQQWQTLLWRLALMGMMFNIAPEVMADSALPKEEIDKLRADRKPFGVLRVSQAMMQGGLKPIITQQMPNFLIPFSQEVERIGSRAVGANEAMNGQSVSGADTAFEVSQIVTQGQKTLLNQVEHLADGEEQVARLILDLNYQHQGHENLQSQWMQANPDDNEGFQEACALLEAGQFTVTMQGVKSYMSSQMRAKVALTRWQMATDPNSPLSKLFLMDGKRLYALAVDLWSSLDDGASDPEATLGTEEDFILVFGELENNLAQQALLAQVTAALGGVPGGEMPQGVGGGADEPMLMSERTPEESQIDGMRSLTDDGRSYLGN